jgi:hypothetical protein
MYTGTVSSSTKQVIVPSSELATYSYGTTNEFTYSIWVYVDNWNTRYGEEKVIFERATVNSDGNISGTPLFKLYLDSYANNLVATTQVIKTLKYTYYESQGITGATAYKNVAASALNAKTLCESVCGADTTCTSYTYSSAKGSCDLFKGNTLKGATGVFSGIKETDYHNCIVPAIDTQKWVNIVVSGSVSSIDMYIDGKLVKTCITNGTLTDLSGTSVVICPGGGFSGWNARFQFYPNYMSPQDVWKIYRSGYNGLFGDMNLDYSVTLGIYKGDVEKASTTF